MATFFSLLGTGISCIFYGIIATAVIMIFLYVLLKCIGGGIVRTIPFYLTGFVLFILLSIQMSLMIGAMEVEDKVDAVEVRIEQIMENFYGTLSATDSQHLLDRLNEEFPLMSLYVDTANFSGNNALTIASSMKEALDDYLDTYIWHRVFWSVGMIFIACLIAICFDKGNGGRTTKKQESMYDSSNGGLQF